MTLSAEELGIRVVQILCETLKYPNYSIISLLKKNRGSCVNVSS